MVDYTALQKNYIFFVALDILANFAGFQFTNTFMRVLESYFYDICISNILTNYRLISNNIFFFQS